MILTEKDLLEKGFYNVCGVDEVGRGPLAGPVVAAAVILKHEHNLVLKDSKKLTAKQRKILLEEIKKAAISISVSFVPPEEIDRINILRASREAMILAINNLKVKADFALVDALDLNNYLEIPSLGIIKGDDLIVSIQAAAIVAKETRDDYMKLMDKYYPEYGFKYHMGYPTKKHLEAIDKHGITKIHRKSFNPIKRMIEEGIL